MRAGLPTRVVTRFIFHPFLFADCRASFLLTYHSKTPFNLTLSGITNDDVDLSVDALKAVTLPLLKHFGVAEEGGLELKVRFARVHRASSWFIVSGTQQCVCFDFATFARFLPYSSDKSACTRVGRAYRLLALEPLASYARNSFS